MRRATEKEEGKKRPPQPCDELLGPMKVQKPTMSKKEMTEKLEKDRAKKVSEAGKKSTLKADVQEAIKPGTVRTAPPPEIEPTPKTGPPSASEPKRGKEK